MREKHENNTSSHPLRRTLCGFYDIPGDQKPYPFRISNARANCGGILIIVSRRVASLRMSRSFLSIVLVLLIFVLWIFPDLLWPTYRQHWLFHSLLIGEARSSLAENDRSNFIFLTLAILVMRARIILKWDLVLSGRCA